MTAREMLRFRARFFYRSPKIEIEQRLEETFKLVGLDDKADRPIRGFSGGELQRLGSGKTLQPVAEHGWRSGFANLLRLETFYAPFGVMVLSQGLIVNEIKSGTAAWLLSNPVSRSSFIFSKLIGHGWAMFIILIMVQSLAAYLQVTLKAGTFFNPLPFIYATGVICLGLLFYLTLALMLGTLFNSTGPVIGIPTALMVGMNLLPQILGGLAPWLVSILPSRLALIRVTRVARPNQSVHHLAFYG